MEKGKAHLGASPSEQSPPWACQRGPCPPSPPCLPPPCSWGQDRRPGRRPPRLPRLQRRRWRWFPRQRRRLSRRPRLRPGAAWMARPRRWAALVWRRACARRGWLRLPSPPRHPLQRPPGWAALAGRASRQGASHKSTQRRAACGPAQEMGGAGEEWLTGGRQLHPQAAAASAANWLCTRALPRWACRQWELAGTQAAKLKCRQGGKARSGTPRWPLFTPSSKNAGCMPAQKSHLFFM